MRVWYEIGKNGRKPFFGCLTRFLFPFRTHFLKHDLNTKTDY